MRTEARSRLTCDKENFYVWGEVEAYLDGELFNRKSWEKTIRRKYL